MSLPCIIEPGASHISTEIDILLGNIQHDELRLATGYARLGRLLLTVQRLQYWQDYGYGSFGKYIEDIKGRIGRQRAWVYNTISVAQNLLPYVSESDLDRMGIARAQELCLFVKRSGQRVKPKLLDMALDGSRTTSELHVAVLEELHEKGEVQGKWWSPVGGSYFTSDERQEVQDAIDLYRNMFPSDGPEHAQNKNMILDWAREFISSNPIGDNDEYFNRL